MICRVLNGPCSREDVELPDYMNPPYALRYVPAGGIAIVYILVGCAGEVWLYTYSHSSFEGDDDD